MVVRSKEQANSSMDGGNDNNEVLGGDFVRRTYRSTVFVALFVLFVLASYDQFWALLPVTAGVALGLGLLRALEWSVREAFTPERARAARQQQQQNRGRKFGPKAALAAAALVKYPLVALLLWAATRFWNEHEVMASAGGFVLVQTVIALRGMGRFVVDRLNETAPEQRGDNALRARR